MVSSAIHFPTKRNTHTFPYRFGSPVPKNPLTRSSSFRPRNNMSLQSMYSPTALSPCPLRQRPFLCNSLGTSVTGVCANPRVRAPIHCPCLLTLQKTLAGPPPRASDQESVAVPVLAGHAILTEPKPSLNTVGSAAAAVRMRTFGC